MRTLLLLFTAAFVLVGCSKDEAPPPATPEPESDEAAAEAEPVAAAPAPAAPAPAVGGDLVSQDLNALASTLEGGDYDSAVTTLSAMGQANLSPAQQQAYQQQLFNTQQYLLQRAQSDPAARDAYQRLGRQVTGR